MDQASEEYLRKPGGIAGSNNKRCKKYCHFLITEKDDAMMIIEQRPAKASSAATQCAASCHERAGRWVTVFLSGLRV
jgi:hypothetical protein